MILMMVVDTDGSVMGMTMVGEKGYEDGSCEESCLHLG